MAGRSRRPRSGPEDPERGVEDAASNPPADPESVARAIVLRKLTAAPRSRAELAQALTERNVDEDVQQRVLDRFTEVGLIDDAGYAELLVRSRQRERGLARRGLAVELRRRGIDGDTAQEALAAVDADSERETARRLVAKRLPALSRYDRDTKVRRLSGMLGRKGYSGALAAEVIREALRTELEDDGQLDAPED